MGGFEGGDEGGFWDVDALAVLIDKQNNNKAKKKGKAYIKTTDSEYRIKAYAKVNIFLKITAQIDEKYTISSRYMRVKNLYDTISFIPCKCENFTIEGCDEIALESNSIYRAYKALVDFTDDSDIVDFFHEHKVVVKKNIPIGAGLGGSSSNGAAFIHLTKEVCNLVLSTNELIHIGSDIGPDIAYFIYDYPSANISGFGEVVEPFEEEVLSLEINTPDMKCDRNIIHKTFEKYLLKNAPLSPSADWEKMDSKSILDLVANPVMLNDLYAAALLAYPALEKEAKEGSFFSGTSFFKYNNQ